MPDLYECLRCGMGFEARELTANVQGEYFCLCGEVLHPVRDEAERDEAYERAAARARGNDFEETGGRDWT